MTSLKSLAIPEPQTAPTVPKQRGIFSPEIPGPKREEFRRYLEKTGVLESVSLALAHLYEEDERVNNPKEYFLNRLMGGVPSPVKIKSIHAEKEILQKQITDLKTTNKHLKEKVRIEEERQLKHAAFLAANEHLRETSAANPSTTTETVTVTAETPGEDYENNL